jgi:hypothetical protein
MTATDSSHLEPDTHHVETPRIQQASADAEAAELPVARY